MTSKYSKHFTILCIITALFTLFIWSNSLLNSEDSGELSKGIADFVFGLFGDSEQEATENEHHILRKLAHFTEFAILGALYMLIKTRIDEKVISSLVFFPLFATLLTAVTDEFIQAFTGRGSILGDVVLDFAGAVFGICIIAVFKYLKNKI